MIFDPERREAAIADLEREHPGYGPAIRRWLASEDLADAQRGRYETTYRLATGDWTPDKLIRSITVLMEGLADDDVWLLSSDPEAWRYVMIDPLHQQFGAFCALVEGACWAPR